MKFFVLFGFLTVTISFVVGLDYDKAIIEIAEAFPGINVVSPEVIQVVFENGAYLDLGKNITPTESKNQPVAVDWNADKDAYYTLIVVDPDAPSRENTYLREVLTWLVGNIPGKDISAGDVLVEYVGTAPPKNMGPNRYFYLLFRQSQKKEYNDEKRIDKYTIEGRMNFSTRDFVQKYKLGNLFGVNFLTSYYDPQTEVLYKQLSCCENLL